MQTTTRAIVLAVAMLASAPLLAAGFDSSTASTNASTETQAKTEQDSCTLPALPSTELTPDKLASLLPKPGSTPPDPAEVDRRLRKAEACARAAGLRAPGEDTTSSATTDSASNRVTIRQRSSSVGL